jgi:hypothetical protein
MCLLDVFAALFRNADFRGMCSGRLVPRSLAALPSPWVDSMDKRCGGAGGEACQRQFRVVLTRVRRIRVGLQY